MEVDGFMNKWKDTARTIKKITKHIGKTEKIVILEDMLFIVEREITEDLYLVTSTNPKKAARRQYKLSNKEIRIEDYDITRDINIQMLLADGWDAQDLLKRE
jgi:hypothetical protein